MPITPTQALKTASVGPGWEDGKRIKREKVQVGDQVTVQPYMNPIGMVSRRQTLAEGTTYTVAAIYRDPYSTMRVLLALDVPEGRIDTFRPDWLLKVAQVPA